MNANILRNISVDFEFIKSGNVNMSALTRVFLVSHMPMLAYKLMKVS
jgi:hypothetical protein